MDVTTITQLVGGLGFPIVMCGALFWQMNKNEERNASVIGNLTEAINELREYIQLNLKGDKDV